MVKTRCEKRNEILSFLSVFRNNLKSTRDDGSSDSCFCSRKDQKLLLIGGLLLMFLGPLLQNLMCLLLISCSERKCSVANHTVDSMESVGILIISNMNFPSFPGVFHLTITLICDFRNTFKGLL